MNDAILEVKDLSVSFLFAGKPHPVISDVSFSIGKGEILGLVGESGSGKSVTAKAILRLIPAPPGKVTSGSIMYGGADILKLKRGVIHSIRGKRISMIFQEPMTSLNPVFTCGDQITEAIILHQKLSKKQAAEKAMEMMRLVGINMPEERMKNYPHQLSGGMRQRVMIAMALSCNPDILIADEPTTALDPTIQAQILQLIKSLQHQMGMSVLFITHDLGVVAEVCDRVVVMYAGRIVESGTKREIFYKTAHPYTEGLMKSMPRMGVRADMLYTIPDTVPHFTEMPPGCPFHPRCGCATQRCSEILPEMYALSESHSARCLWAADGSR